jgi:hypothetical protein
MDATRAPESVVSSPRETWLLIGSRYALTWPVFGFYLLPHALAIVMLSTTSPDAATPAQWAVIAIVTWLAPVLTLLAIRFTLLPNRPRPSKPVITLLAFACAGIVRALSFDAIQGLLHVVDQETPAMRLVGGTLTVVVVFTLLALLVSARREFVDEVTQLSDERKRLTALKESLVSQSRARHAQLVKEAQDIVLPVIASLQQSVLAATDAATLAAVSDSMRSAVDTVIRPLSQSLARRDPIPDPEPVEKAVRRVRASLPRQTPAVGRLILPLSFTVFISLMSFGSLFFFLNPLEAVRTLEVIFICLFSMLWIARVATLFVRVNLLFNTVVFVAAHVVSAIAIINLLQLIGTSIPPVLFDGWVVLVGLTAFLLFYYEVVAWGRRRIVESLALVNSEIEVVLSSLRQQFKIDARDIANTIHGPVQTALYASAIRLSQVHAVDDDVVAVITSDLSAAVQSLTSDKTEVPSVHDFVAEIQRVWGEAVEVSLIVGDGVTKALSNQPTARSCVIEVIREGVNNAIKHAGARLIIVKISMEDSRLVEVAVRNDGMANTSVGEAGFGSRVLDEYTHQWTLTTSYNTTTLWARVACDRIEVSPLSGSL